MWRILRSGCRSASEATIGIRVLGGLFTFAIGVVALPASAATFTATGKISQYGATSPGNRDFRVYVGDIATSPLATCAFTFAFTDSTDGNYLVKVATVMSNYSQDKNITMVVDKEASGYCRILEIYTAV